MRKANLASLGAGLLFGLGLGISGMTLPSKVMGFLDFTGNWDASLAFVMIGAIAVHSVLFRLILKRSSPLFDGKFHLPSRTDIDPRLIAGAAIFGIGWGFGGFCPGPGLVSVVSGQSSAVIFVVTMLVGMFAHQAFENSRTKSEPKRAAEGSIDQSLPSQG